MKRSGNCPLCGTHRPYLQRDHVVPKHKGGTNDSSNFQYICANCHEDKTRLEQSELMKGKPKSLEHRIKIGLAHKGFQHSLEAKKKMSERGKGRSAWNKGNMGGALSSEHRAKISAANKHTVEKDAFTLDALPKASCV